jgi:SAM-dependent methyltransferase
MPVDKKHDDLRALWDCRAREKKDHCNSVLFQGLPDSLNTYIHNVHWNTVNNYLLPLIPRNSTILDLGCGYGRIASLIARTRPDIELYCVDFSLTYCSLCSKNTSVHVACADILNLPFRNGVFDSIVAITSLMYVPVEKRAEIMKKIVLLLKPEGKALFIDPGEEYMNLMAFLRPSSKRKSTGGQGFRLDQYLDLGTSGGSVILNHGGMPLFSLAVPLLYLISRLPRLTGKLLDIIGRIDECIFQYSRFSIHRWMLITR